MGWKERFARLPRKAQDLYTQVENLSDAEESLATPSSAAQEVDPNFAMELLLFSWEETLHEAATYKPYFRPAIKRAIIELRSVNPGQSRSIRKLATLVASCALAQDRELEAHQASWNPGPFERSIELQITGERIQTASFTSGLFQNLESSLDFSARRAKGDNSTRHPSTEVMNIARGLEAISGVETFWKEVYLRLALSLHVTQRHLRAGADPAKSFTLLPTRMTRLEGFGDLPIQHLEIDEDDLLNHLCFQGTDRPDDLDLVIRPALKATHGVITSTRLIGESIAPYALRWIHESGGWLECISKPFEARVEAELRARGFAAGSVSRKGIWDTGEPSTYLHEAMAGSASSCPGEIDVVSSDGSTFQLFECKSIYPFSKLRNIVGRVSDEDTSGWISNATRKVEWLESATGREVSFASMIVDGVTHRDDATLDQPVSVVDFNTFESSLKEIDNLIDNT